MTENNCDWIKVYPCGSKANPTFGDQTISGMDYTRWKEINGTQVPGDTVSFEFHSDGSNEQWGIRAFIRAVRYGDVKDDCAALGSLIARIDEIRGPAKEQSEEKIDWSGLDPSWRVWESLHPYADNTNISDTVTVPHASHLMLYLDPKTKTEDNHDNLVIHKGTSDTNAVTKALFGEFNNEGMWKDHSPFIIEKTESATFRFVSDASRAFWGVRIFVKGLGDNYRPEFDDEKFSLLGRDDPSKLPLSLKIPEVYVIQSFDLALKRTVAGKPLSQTAFYLRDIQELSHSGIPHGFGFLIDQKKSKALEKSKNLNRMIAANHCLKIIGLIARDLTPAQIDQVITPLGYNAKSFILMLNNFFKYVKIE